MGRPAIPLEQKLLDKLIITETCWFVSSKAGNSFGHKTLSYKHKNTGAHVVAYELWIGPVPDGLRVLHKCDVPGCVNPDHLFSGTQLENCQDAVSKGRSGRYGRGDGITCPCGLEYRISPKGQKYCAICCNKSKTMNKENTEI